MARSSDVGYNSVPLAITINAVFAASRRDPIPSRVFVTVDTVIARTKLPALFFLYDFDMAGAAR